MLSRNQYLHQEAGYFVEIIGEDWLRGQDLNL